jgi:O-antigen/teichoic acid export membrane protein
LSLKSIFFSTSFILLAIRLTGAGAGFLSQLLLARLLAPDALGIFFAATSLAAVVGLATCLGYPEIVPRFLSRYRERARPGWGAAFLHRAFRDALLAGLAAGGAILLFALWSDVPTSSRIAFVMAGVSVPFIALFMINYAIAISHRAFSAAYIPESLMRPILFCLALAALFFAGSQMGLVGVTAIFFGITFAMGSLQYWLIRKRIPPGPPQAPRRLRTRWRIEGMPLIAVTLYINLFADLAIILASPLLASAELAAFGIALKLAMLVGFVVQVAHQVILPDLADAYARRALSEARDTLRAASALPVVVTLAAVIAAALAGEYVLAVFHPDFAAAKWVLTMLIGCQLLRALAGPSALMITTIGAQGLNASICLASTAVLALGNVVFIPMAGLDGAAFAVLLAWIFWLGASAWALQSRAGLRCDLVALLRRGDARREAPAPGE